MAFEVYFPTGCRARIAAGTASLDRCGNLRFTREDADAAKISTDRVAILFDKSTRRLALRTPRDGDASVTLVRITKKGTLRNVFTARVVGALLQIGFAGVAQCAGTYPTLIKDDLVIVDVSKRQTKR